MLVSKLFNRDTEKKGGEMNKVTGQLLSVFVLALVGFLTTWSPAHAAQTNIVGAAGSGQFGATVTVLPNGNLVVTDPYYSTPSVTNAGAVYLYNGETLNLISTLTGNQADDQIGLVTQGGSSVIVLNNGNYLVRSVLWHSSRGAVTWCSATAGATGVVSSVNSLVGSTVDDKIGSFVTVLSNGNYVVCSPLWDNNAVADAGAATWGNGTVGTMGAVSAANSLIGSTANDQVGGSISEMAMEVANGVIALANGNYVVSDPAWDNGGMADAGAVTWGNGAGGTVGAISAANSLVGTAANDQVGGFYDMWMGAQFYVTALPNGHYVVRSPYWNNGMATVAGAVTWGNGTGGTVGAVSAANSLVGSTADDSVGSDALTMLANGNYVVGSSRWSSNKGAATWVNGTAGVAGTVSAANSLVGSTVNDAVGNLVKALTNGNYVVISYYWDNGAVANAGAVTWGSGTAGVVGTISAANSLVGDVANSYIGTGGVTALANGNYLLFSPQWNNSRGAVTWCSGTAGVTGVLSAANSLVGSTADDSFSINIIALANGNYVVTAPYWRNGALERAGAATWGSGTTGVTGTISVANSLIGTNALDYVGIRIKALANGNYVVGSTDWDNGATANVGAATWCNGTNGRTGTISVTNSLIGSNSGDYFGDALTALANGNYLVSSIYCKIGTVVNAGAVTWCSGTTGLTGVVSAVNSLVGSTTSDYVGKFLTALPNGNYVVGSPDWQNGSAVKAGAATWGNGMSGTVGAVSAANSLVGVTSYDNVGGSAIALPNDDYIVVISGWDNGAIVNAGAITWGDGDSGITPGTPTSDNSMIGNVSSGGNTMGLSVNPVGNYLLAGYPAGNRVMLLGYVPPALTTTGTPHWWLAQYGLTNFEADAISDTDGDGLVTWREYLSGTCPTNAFTGGNPFNDGVLVGAGVNPLGDYSAILNAVTNHPALFGLYNTNSIADLSLGLPMINVVSNNARVWMTLEVSHDLSNNTWTNVGNVVEWNYSVTTNKAFFRFRGSTVQ